MSKMEVFIRMKLLGSSFSFADVGVDAVQSFYDGLMCRKDRHLDLLQDPLLHPHGGVPPRAYQSPLQFHLSILLMSLSPSRPIIYAKHLHFPVVPLITRQSEDRLD